MEDLELLEGVHGSSLGCFRLLLGCNFLLQSFIWQRSLDDFSSSALVFPYPRPFQPLWPPFMLPAGDDAAGFATAMILSPAAARATNAALGLAAAMVALGLCTRAAASVVFCSFSLLFSHCQSMHNNHYVLLCWAAALLVCTDTARWGPVSHRR